MNGWTYDDVEALAPEIRTRLIELMNKAHSK